MASDAENGKEAFECLQINCIFLNINMINTSLMISWMSVQKPKFVYTSFFSTYNFQGEYLE